MKSKLDLKQQLYQRCADLIDLKLSKIHTQIQEIQLALSSETKSSAGDKHETGRAMMQLEREKVGQQLAETEKLKALLAQIPIKQTHETIGLGSLVKTSDRNYFIAVSLGMIEVGGQHFFAISPNTPIGLLLRGQTKGAEIIFRDQRFKIEEVF